MQKGKVLITGGTSGLGYELVKFFIRAGNEVYATGRDQKKIIDLGKKLHFVNIDFSDMAVIKKSMNDLLNNGARFDIVINNAGVLSPPEFTPTGNGIEYSFQVNFLSHLLLAELLVREKLTSEPLTIVSVTSPVFKYYKPRYDVHEYSNYRSFRSYAESKFYLLLIGEYLKNKYQDKNLKFIGYDPGIFSSGIYRMQKGWFQRMYRIASPFMRSPVKVAANLAEILGQENIVDGAVYTRRNRFTNPDINNERVGEFLKECSNIIRPYL